MPAEPLRESLQPFVKAPQAQAAVKRPRIFVYDLPAVYNTRMVQYRVVKVQLSFLLC